MEVYNEATAFVRKALSAAPRSQPGKKENDSSDFTGARREHTIELLGEEYGTRLLREASETKTSDAPAKLALLHHLHGNVDDVRFWAAVAAVANREYTPPASIQESLEEARRYALGYQRARDFAAARVYLSLAADKEDALSAFQLGIMAESEADVTEAIAWYKKAATFGHPDGDERAYRLWRTLH
ncbi:hypothetical protein AB0K18_20495 [Nonomuraea sp. NPDC049421]|uniref:hypothetical protein n=1 Tax=Nonomuraea sp. NPDC049421 TaxID=3155275 RepID=UPI003448238E